jgi:hypothetical protein
MLHSMCEKLAVCLSPAIQLKIQRAVPTSIEARLTPKTTIYL